MSDNLSEIKSFFDSLEKYSFQYNIINKISNFFNFLSKFPFEIIFHNMPLNKYKKMIEGFDLETLKREKGVLKMNIHHQKGLLKKNEETLADTEILKLLEKTIGKKEADKYINDIQIENKNYRNLIDVLQQRNMIVKEEIKKRETITLTPSTKRKLAQALPKTATYKQWIEADKELQDYLELAMKTNIPKKDFDKKVKELQDKSNLLYESFRILIEPQIITDKPEWDKAFLDALRSSSRFRYRTKDDVKGGAMKEIVNPFFDILFANNNLDKDKSQIIIRLSPDGNFAYLNYEFKDSKGGWKSPSRAYMDLYQDVIRSEYNGRWDRNLGFNVLKISDLNDALSDLRSRGKRINNFGKTNFELQYYILQDRAFWEQNANVPRKIVKMTKLLLFEVIGKQVFIKGDKETVRIAKEKLNGEYSRVIDNYTYEEIIEAVNKDNIMDVGLLDEAYWFLDAQGLEPIIIDQRPRKVIANPNLKSINLREYQKKAIAEALIEGDGLIISPTGSGKTEIGAGIISGFIEGSKEEELRTGVKDDTDVVFLVHLGTLGEQAQRKLKERLGMEIGRITGDDKYHHPIVTDDCDVNVTSIASLANALRIQREYPIWMKERYPQWKKQMNNLNNELSKTIDLDKQKKIKLQIKELKDEEKQKGKPLTLKQEEIIRILQNADVIIQDEAHHLSADTHTEVFEYNLTRHKYGLTATPDRRDTEAIMVVMKIGTKREVASLKELQLKGYLMRPKIVEIPIKNDSKVTAPRRNGLKRQAQERDTQIVTNQKRNNYICSLANDCNTNKKTTVIFTELVKHAKKLQTILKNKYNLHVDLLTGAVKQDKRNTIIDNLTKRKDYLVIASNKLLSEGFDLPTMDYEIIADSGGSSRILVLQRVGRVMRIMKGKQQPIIYEFNDQSQYLKEQFKTRIAIYKSEDAFDFEQKPFPY